MFRHLIPVTYNEAQNHAALTLNKSGVSIVLQNIYDPANHVNQLPQ